LILKNEDRSANRFSFAEKGHVEHQSIQNQRWKLVRSFPPKKGTDAPFKDRLYDLSADPHEKKDVSKEHPETYEDLKKKLEAWIDGNHRRQKAYRIQKADIDPELQKQLDELGYGTGDG
jgi:arylsulfatase A-like enzyme